MLGMTLENEVSRSLPWEDTTEVGTVQGRVQSQANLSRAWELFIE